MSKEYYVSLYKQFDGLKRKEKEFVHDAIRSYLSKSTATLNHFGGSSEYANFSLKRKAEFGVTADGIMIGYSYSTDEYDKHLVNQSLELASKSTPVQPLARELEGIIKSALGQAKNK